MIKKSSMTLLLCAIFLLGCNQTSNPTTETQEDKHDNTENTVEESQDEGKAEETVADESSTEHEAKETVSGDLPTLSKQTLQKLDEGEEVITLQTALQEIGYDLEITGVFDALTVWAMTDIQLQVSSHNPSGIYDQAMHDTLEAILADKVEVVPEKGLSKPADTAFASTEVENPYDILSLVNKEFSLPADYVPVDLTVPQVDFPFAEDDPKKQLRKEAADALETLFADAKQDDVHLFAQSGYRSYERQEDLFASYSAQNGEDAANTYSARAGESEHQTGLVMDVTAQSVDFTLTTDFGETKEGKWLKENAHQHGFIIRYPLGKEHITKYQYEPWHLRYIGQKAATEIMTNDLTLEEYLNK